jgi:magnesium chelatase family protein
MLAKVSSFALIGLDSTLVEVEVDLSRGLPSQTIVGLPDPAVRESTECLTQTEMSRCHQAPQ